MKKSDKPINPKDPILGKRPVVKTPSPNYESKAKAYLENKTKMGKSDEINNQEIDPQEPSQQSHEMISVPHILFSMDNPAHGQHNEHDHTAMMHVLKNMGADVHETQGHYGGNPERSILVRNPDENISNTISHLARKQGQESVLHSDGQNHELHFLNGDMVGKHVKGSGTEYHQEAPQTNYSTLPDGTTFSHNLDFSQEHDNE